MEVYLSLADGKVFTGYRLTSKEEVVGALSFNTNEFAFEECITNPANTGKIIMFTFPLIGVMGINYEDNQSSQVTVDAVICKENSDFYSNFRAKTSIKDYLEENNKLYADKFDTRAIMVYLRENGEMPAVLGNKPLSKEEVVKKYNEKIDNYKQINYPLNENKKYKAKFIDLGASKTFYKFMDEIGFYNSEDDYDYIIISNSNYKSLESSEIVKFIKNSNKKVIAFGDSNIFVAKAFGLDFKPLGLGHHGSNIPIKNLLTGKDHITNQNHLFYIPKQDKIDVLYKNIHDDTTEVYISKNKNFAGFNVTIGKESFIKIINAMEVK